MEDTSGIHSLATRLKNTMIQYYNIEDNEWRVARKTKDVTVWRKPSEEFSGYLYKTQGIVEDITNRIIDHIRPGPYRISWDSLMTTMDIVEKYEEHLTLAEYNFHDSEKILWEAGREGCEGCMIVCNSWKSGLVVKQPDCGYMTARVFQELELQGLVNCCVMRYTTAGQILNIIAPREFIDFSYTTNCEDGLLSCGISLDHDEVRPSFVRGFNHPCGWFCFPLMDNPRHSLLVGFIQTDLRGMLPQSVVDTAMAGTLISFYSDLRKALKA